LWVRSQGRTYRGRGGAELLIASQFQGIRAALAAGCNAFVFKISQREGYWQLLFAPEWRTPYGMQDFLYVLPFERWRGEAPLWRWLRPLAPLRQN
ncbi:MAG: hypothetical protein N3A66_08525, partial [Planctomycetota bacterium]|nr:hypothetical protein [Planctomycetota bacterium]